MYLLLAFLKDFHTQLDSLNITWLKLSAALDLGFESLKRLPNTVTLSRMPFRTEYYLLQIRIQLGRELSS